MHSTIERQCRKKEIFTQEQWGINMEKAKIDNPYRVNHITQSDIKNFGELSSQFNRSKIPIMQVKEIIFDPNNEDRVSVRYNDFEYPLHPAPIF